MPCNAMQYAMQAMPCNVMQCHAMPCNAMQCHAIPCSAMQYHAMPCRAIFFKSFIITIELIGQICSLFFTMWVLQYLETIVIALSINVAIKLCASRHGHKQT